VPNFTLGFLIKAKDTAILNAFKRMGKGAEKFARRSEKSFARATKSALGLKTVMGGILGSSAVMRGGFLLRQGVGAITEEFVSFDHAITSAGAKFPGMVKRGSKAFDQLTVKAREIGAATEFTATEAAQSLEFFAMAGFTTDQAMAVLGPAVDLATASNMDLARASDIASDALGAFNLRSKDSEQLTKNLTRINDVFARTVTKSNVTLENLFESMKDGGPTMTLAGQSVESFAAAIGIMGDAGIKGSKGGTVLKNAMLRMTAPPAAARRAMESLNLELENSDGSMKKFSDIIAGVEKGLVGMSTKQKTATLNALFGRRAIAGMSVVLSAGSDAVREYEDSLYRVTGASRDMAAEMRQSLQNRLKTLKSAAIELGFKFLEAFQDKFPGAIDGAIEAVRGFDMKPVIEGVKTFISFIKEAWTIFRALEPVIAMVVGAFLTYKGVIIAITAAQTALNLVMNANPIGIIITLIGALTGAVIWLTKNWDEFVAAARNEFPAAVKVIETAIEYLKAGFEALADFLTRLWDDPLGVLKGFFKTATNLATEFLDWLGEATGFWDPSDKQKLSAGSIGGGLANMKIPGTSREAPNANKAAAEAERREIGFRGELNINGAPKGSTFTSDTWGAPPIQTNMAGANL